MENNLQKLKSLLDWLYLFLGLFDFKEIKCKCFKLIEKIHVNVWFTWL